LADCPRLKDLREDPRRNVENAFSSISHGDHTRAIEYEDIEYCIADGGEKEREREREQEISIYLLHGRLSQCGMSPDIPNRIYRSIDLSL
jgi:hypothetical protein